MDAVELTRKLVEIDSTDPGNFEIKIEHYIKDILEKLPKDKIKIYESEVFNGRINLMAVFSKDKNYVVEDLHDEVIFICHMDTVVVGDNWTMDAFHNNFVSGRIYGRGATDMKSGLATALTVFSYIVENYNNDELKKDFKVIFTVDEEANMKGVEKVIADKWVHKDYFICDLEPTDKMIQVSHKGRFWVKLNVEGKTAHASRPELGIDANAVLAEIISYIRKEVSILPIDDELGKTSVTFGLMSGGYQPYVVPDKSEVYMDFRLTPPTTNNDIIKIVEEAINSAKKEINENAKINYVITGDRAYVKKNDNSKFLASMINTLDKLYIEKNDEDYKPKVTFFSGYTDTAVIASTIKNGETFSYGPGNLSLAHKSDEYVEIKDINRCVEVYKELIQNLIF